MNTGGFPSTSWWVSETIPEDVHELVRKDLQDGLPDGSDAEQFCRWLGPELGRYRDALNQRAAVGPIEAEREYVRQLRKSLRQTRGLLNEIGNPLRVRALLADASLHRIAALDGTWREVVQRLGHDAHRLEVLLGEIERGLEAPGRRGRKQTGPRDALLAAIVDHLRTRYSASPSGARALAAQVLRRCGVHAPDDDRAVRRAAVRGQK